MTTEARHDTREMMRGAYNFSVGYWDSLQHQSEVVQPILFAAIVGRAILARYPVLNEIAATLDPPRTGQQLAELIAIDSFRSSMPNYWPDQAA
jgi:hypothetical protein